MGTAAIKAGSPDLRYRRASSLRGVAAFVFSFRFQIEIRLNFVRSQPYYCVLFGTNLQGEIHV